jgi:hypothetical protein
MTKNFTIAAGALIALACATPASAGVDVSINLGEPGFYGQIELGGAPPPRVIYAQPRIIEHVVVEQEPIYLHVRPGHSRNWARYCGEYNACGRRVYFVNDNWYNTTYVQYRHGGHGDGNRHDDDRHDGDRVEDGHGGHHDNGRHNGHGKSHHHD